MILLFWRLRQMIAGAFARDVRGCGVKVAVWHGLKSLRRESGGLAWVKAAAA